MIDLSIDGRIARVTFNGPPANAINPAWCDAFHGCLDRIDSAGCAVVHIRSALKLFCAGADLKHIAAGFDLGDQALTEFITSLEGYQRLFQRIEDLPCVTVAEIHGAALGGGLELALACDLRVVADDASLGLPEASLGLLPGIGGTQRLTAICGEAYAKRLILTAEVIRGAEAVERGIAQWWFEASRLASETETLVQRMSQMPSTALKSAKDCIRVAVDRREAGFAREIARSRELYCSDETRLAVRNFLNRNRSKARGSNGS